jgi:hypothetical protein
MEDGFFMKTKDKPSLSLPAGDASPNHLPATRIRRSSPVATGSKTNLVNWG